MALSNYSNFANIITARKNESDLEWKDLHIAKRILIIVCLVLLLLITGVFGNVLWLIYNCLPIEEMTTGEHIERITAIMEEEHTDKEIVVVPLKSFSDYANDTQGEVKYYYVRVGNSIPMVLNEYRNRYYCYGGAGFSLNDDLVNEEIYVEDYNNFRFCAMEIDGQLIEINTQQVLNVQFCRNFSKVCDKYREELAYRTFMGYADYYSYG